MLFWDAQTDAIKDVNGVTIFQVNVDCSQTIESRSPEGAATGIVLPRPTAYSDSPAPDWINADWRQKKFPGDENDVVATTNEAVGLERGLSTVFLVD